mmetsp:Transcript_51922/g.123605  ORF Transcript_51922/g.123605 Transcript_51922/m.123605 type:complete len:126 (+) Transcript_51922:116-493(+)|eukprot:CAMPEP_0178440862 /NCGR_PEP_ID=MMETSP0689_2-20121128/37075_1 /TAXON_ID=160604 /ORGANISM="Amphidinium massartii, Strain CS-259" /LENGTH=125 /DNA_ID=CAMNT_0020063805 /DNA_START=57 /DNA_END=434 /DNA_ORIENTATION=+
MSSNLAAGSWRRSVSFSEDIVVFDDDGTSSITSDTSSDGGKTPRAGVAAKWIADTSIGSSSIPESQTVTTEPEEVQILQEVMDRSDLRRRSKSIGGYNLDLSVTLSLSLTDSRIGQRRGWASGDR